MACAGEWRVFVHLAYLDDAGTNAHSPIAMFGAVIIPYGTFGHVENLHGAAIQQIVPADQIEEKFEEFHASALFNGDPPFDGIDEKRRFDAISVLLTAVQIEQLPYIYAAVDRNKLKDSPMATANPMDVAFRLCLLGVEEWARSKHPQRVGSIQLDFKDMCLFIVDDTTDSMLKKQLRNSYRSLRAAHPYIPPNKNRLWHAHDALYFSDSRESLGIQMADLCNYFMWRNLLGREGGETFYNIFSVQASSARPEPEWSKYRDLFVVHDDFDKKEVVEPNHDANAKGQTT
jgi:hypothetical protein